MSANPNPYYISQSPASVRTSLAQDIQTVFEPLIQTQAEIAAGVIPVNFGFAPMDVRRYGAKGDGVTDDTFPIQAAVNVAMQQRGTVYLPATALWYKTTVPISITAALDIKGDGPNGSQIISAGIVSNYILDFNCVAANIVENIQISGITIRSDNNLATGMRLNNVANVLIREVRYYNLADGEFLDGTRTFNISHEHVAVAGTITNCVRFAPNFIGGGQFVFDSGCAFGGSVGILVPTTAFVDTISCYGVNFEGCSANGVQIRGTCATLAMPGCRFEAGTGIDVLLRPFGAAEYVYGFTISAMFDKSNAAAQPCISMGGDAGLVRGFSITGCTVRHSISAYGTTMVQLNGDGNSGLISGNRIQGTTGGGAGVVSGQRPGVVVFGNENVTGALPEYWGQATGGMSQGTWTPTDGSGAALAFTAASGQWTQLGRQVFWQAFVQYPATASGNNSEIAGLPFAVGHLGGNGEGRAGAVVNVTNLGAVIGIYQGLNVSTDFTFVNPQTGASITNATLSGKFVYCSGTYSQ